MFSSLHDRVAIVTGATSGIGAGIARELAGAGATCLLLGRDEARGREVVASIESDAEVRFERCDVTDPADVERVVKAAKEELGGVHILVNNAGITRDGLLMRMKEDDWDAVMSTNLRSVYLLTRAVASLMVRARWGRIISITSVVGIHGNAGQANYAASKAGIIGFTKSVARELAPRGITANAVAPGFIQTPMTDALPDEVRTSLLGQVGLGRLGTPDDIAPLVRFLASPEAGYISGQVVAVDGCLRM
jgi:3-oxoacyl-[acyl-carrier protein] reductase